jgi:hypothetical protein
VNDTGIAALKGLKKLRSLSMEGCPVTSQCMETIGGIVQRHRGTTFCRF